MVTPTLFEITQAVLAVLVVVGSGVMTVAGALTTEPFIAVVSIVLGYYFGVARSDREMKAIERAAQIEARIQPAIPGIRVGE